MAIEDKHTEAPSDEPTAASKKGQEPATPQPGADLLSWPSVCSQTGQLTNVSVIFNVDKLLSGNNINNEFLGT